MKLHKDINYVTKDYCGCTVGHEKFPYSDDIYWYNDGTVWDLNGVDFPEIGGIHWKQSLRQVVDGDKLIMPMPDLKRDDEVIVWNDDAESTHKRHFAQWNERGRIGCYYDGRTSHTNPQHTDVSYWDNYKVVK